jgi:hypothetical protein
MIPDRCCPARQPACPSANYVTCGFVALPTVQWKSLRPVSDSGVLGDVGPSRRPSPRSGHKPESASAAPRPAGTWGRAWYRRGGSSLRTSAPKSISTGLEHPAAGHRSVAPRSRSPGRLGGGRSPPGSRTRPAAHPRYPGGVAAAQLQLGARADRACVATLPGGAAAAAPAGVGTVRTLPSSFLPAAPSSRPGYSGSSVAWSRASAARWR